MNKSQKSQSLSFFIEDIKVSKYHKSAYFKLVSRKGVNSLRLRVNLRLPLVLIDSIDIDNLEEVIISFNDFIDLEDV